MSVDIGQLVQEGVQRTLARNGLIFVAITWVLSLLNALFGNAVARNAVDQMPRQIRSTGGFGGASVGPTFGLSPAVAGLLSMVVGILSLVVVAAALRTFVTSEQETIPSEYFRRNLGWMLVNLIIGGIVFGIAVGIGFVLLVIPGIFLMVSLFFWHISVVVEDENFIEGFQDSWALTRGNRLMLFLLGVVVMIVNIVIGIIFGIPQSIVGGGVGLAIGQIGSAFGSVFLLAVAARTYKQLTGTEKASGEL